VSQSGRNRGHFGGAAAYAKAMASMFSSIVNVETSTIAREKRHRLRKRWRGRRIGVASTKLHLCQLAVFACPRAGARPARAAC